MSGANIFRRLRGALGNAVVWGACWSAATLAMFAALRVAGEPVSWHNAWQNAARAGVVGGLTSVAFSGVIGLLYRGRRLSEISWVRFGVGGGVVAGLVLPAIMLVGRTVSGDGPLPMEKWISSALLAAVFGGIAAGASLKLAQLGGTRLPAGSQDALDRLERGDLFAAAGERISWFVYVIQLSQALDRRSVMASLEDSDLAVRRFDPSRFDEEIGTYLELYNRSLEGNWGFTPLQEGEVKQIAEELRHVLAPEFAAFAMVDGKAVGAVLALLDYNQIIRRLNGRLLPFGIFRLLWGKKRIDVARAMAVTMLPDFQQSGFGIVLLDQLVEAAKPWGLKRWEFSWVLESNTSSRGTLERAGTKLSKTYRIYDREL